IIKVFIIYIERPQVFAPYKNLTRKVLKLIIEIRNKSVLLNAPPSSYTIITLEKYIRGGIKKE
nr:hypothetical protein [Escherichia coli]